MTPAQFIAPPDPRPKGFFTCRDWAKKWQLSPCRTGDLLRSGIDQKSVVCLHRRVKVGQRIMRVPLYGPAKNAPTR